MRHRSPRPHYPLAAILLQPALSLPASCTPRLPSVLNDPLSSRSFDHPRVLFRPTAGLQPSKRARSLLRGHVLGRDKSPGRTGMYSVKTYGLENGRFGVMTRRGFLCKQQGESGVNRRLLDSRSPLSDRRGRITPMKTHEESVDCLQTKESDTNATASRCAVFYIQENPGKRKAASNSAQRSTHLPAIFSKLKLSDSTERESVFRPPILH
jgi:hypothetical protein